MGAGGRRLLGVVGTRFRTVFLPACARHNSVVSGRSFIAALVGAVIDVLGSAIRRFRTAINAFVAGSESALSAPAVTDAERVGAMAAREIMTRVLHAQEKGRFQPSEGLARARGTSRAARNGGRQD